MQRRVALFTGAGRQQGLGFEVCRQLAAGGAAVLLTAGEAERAQEMASELAGAGEVHGLALDVDSDASVAAAAEESERRWGQLDVLVKNAAGGFDPATARWR